MGALVRSENLEPSLPRPSEVRFRLSGAALDQAAAEGPSKPVTSPPRVRLKGMPPLRPHMTRRWAAQAKYSVQRGY